jgi:putative Mg2+ transporter-C (MgtC) family protein
MTELETTAPVLRIVMRLCFAVLLGALVGWDRERREKPAGLRTHMMVTLGSASFVLMAFDAAAATSTHFGVAGLDPTRVLQGVVGGIGFLGAGSIIQGRGHVKGVTTAASLWVSGALGAACGIGAYLLAIVTAALALIILSVIGRLEPQGRNHVEPPTDERADSQPRQALRSPPAA